MNPREVVRKLTIAIAATLLLSNCTQLAPYDESTDKALTSLATKTETFLADSEATGASHARSAPFYRNARSEVKAIRMRSELYEKNEEEVQLLGHLSDRYTELEDFHREGKMRSSAAGGWRVTMASLMHVQIAKKRSKEFSTGLKKDSGS